MPNCLLYTSYMKRIVATKCHAEGLAALLPCFWVYMHVGKCMLKLRDNLGTRYVTIIKATCRIGFQFKQAFNPREVTLKNVMLFIHSAKRPASYDAWIDMYGGEDFEKEVKDYIAMVDSICKTVDEATLKEMEKHFIMSCKLEHMFWDQAQTKMEWPKIA